MLNALILRPLNVAGARPAAPIVQKAQGDDNQSYPDYLDYRARNTTFTDMAAYRLAMAGMSVGGAAEKTLGVRSLRQLLRHAGRAARNWAGSSMRATSTVQTPRRTSC